MRVHRSEIQISLKSGNFVCPAFTKEVEISHKTEEKLMRVMTRIYLLT